MEEFRIQTLGAMDRCSEDVRCLVCVEEWFRIQLRRPSVGGKEAGDEDEYGFKRRLPVQGGSGMIYSA